MSLASRFVTTDLAYVKEQLRRVGPAEWKPIAKAARINVKTIRRIVSDETRGPRSDTVGKIAMYFRTKEKRAEAKSPRCRFEDTCVHSPVRK